MRRPLRFFTCLTVAIVGLAAGIPAWRHFAPVFAQSGWRQAELAGDLKMVSALAKGPNGRLWLTEEMPNGRGRLLRREADGSLESLAEGLSKPDGMVDFLDGVAYSQEEGEQPVIWWHGDRREVLFEGFAVEGLAAQGQYLYAIEDRKGNGRLLRYDAQSHETRVLLEGLDQAESVAVCPDGSLVYLQKQLGEVRKLDAAHGNPRLISGLNQPGFLLCNGDGLWVTEDATHMARVLRLDGDGVLHTVLSHLRSPQTLLQVGPGRYLLAEQGRDRILSLEQSVLN